MKKILCVLLMGLASAVAQTFTPNVQLQLPPHGAPNWDTTVNSNFTKIDTALAFAQAIFQGTWANSTPYAKGVFVNSGGSLYMSLLNSNFNNDPATSPLAWRFMVSAGTGTVTSISTSGLSSIFSASITNPTSTPALTFTLLNTPTGTGGLVLAVNPNFPQLASTNAAGITVSGNGSGLSFIDGSSGTFGQGGFLAFTNDASNVTGYGSWLTNNAYYNGTSWIQPRGVGTASTGFTANFHKGFSFNRAAATGTNNTAFTWTEVANIDSTGLLTLGNVARTATGTCAAPAYSFVPETGSGWFRQQAGIMGFCVGGSYLTQYTATRIGNAPGVSLGWASGAPNSFTDDVNISRISPGLLGLGTGSAGSVAGSLNLTNLTASATVTAANVTASATVAAANVTASAAVTAANVTASAAVNAKTINTVQNVAKYATGGSGTSVSPWTSASGTGGCQEAVNACGANGCSLNFTEGVYSFTNTTTGCVLADNVTFDSVGRSAILQAGANNAVFFSDSTHANFVRFFNLTLDGNAFTGVKGIDLTTARFGVTIRDVNFNNMNQGFVSTTGQFAAEMRNVSFRAVTAPINIVANSSSLKMDYITIDNENFIPTVACTNGINIQSGALSNLGNYLNGGFIQGCATGLLDQAVGLTVIGTYFEDNTVADISCSGAFNSHYIHTNHWGAVGPVAIKGRTCTGAKIDNPIMGSGSRSTGLFDWDGTNTQSVAEYIVNGSSMNTPQGTVTGLNGSKLVLGKLALNGDTALSASPRITWVGFQPGNIGAATISRFTPDKPITITSIEAVSTVITTCTVNPTITITGTTTSTLTLTTGAAQWTTGAIANNYSGGGQMTMIAGTTGTCTTPPANLNIIVQYKMQ